MALGREVYLAPAGLLNAFPDVVREQDRLELSELVIDPAAHFPHGLVALGQVPARVAERIPEQPADVRVRERQVAHAAVLAGRDACWANSRPAR